MDMKITLKAARVNAGLTQAQLGKKLGVSRGLVNGWEKGKVSMREAYIYAFCAITGINESNIIFPKRYA